MNKIEKKVLNKYKKHITYLVKQKYAKKCKEQVKCKKFYFDKNCDKQQEFKKLYKEFYKSYIPFIKEEIESKVNIFVNSEKFKELVEIENNLNKKKLSVKNLKKFQDFKINIQSDFLNILYEEVNKESKNIIQKEELNYILLCIIYKIIDYIKNGYKIKIGTLLNIWVNKRDVLINLPIKGEKIIPDRLIPKCKLCSAFDYKLFTEINKDNEPIKIYYKKKMERYLSIFQRKI